MIDHSTISLNPDASMMISNQAHELQIKNRKQQVKLEQQDRKMEAFEAEKAELIQKIKKLTQQYEESIRNNQVLKNSLDNNIQLLRMQKKQNQTLNQKLQMLKEKREKEESINQKMNSINKESEYLKKQIENRQMIIQRLTQQITQNSQFLTKINSMNQLVTKAKKQAQENKFQLEKERQQRNFYKEQMASSVEKTLAVQQQFSRYKIITKTMIDDLTVEFSRQKKQWKHSYQSDLTFYKQQYHLFKDFVEDILRYLKTNNLYTQFRKTSPKIHQFILSKM